MGLHHVWFYGQTLVKKQGLNWPKHVWKWDWGVYVRKGFGTCKNIQTLHQQKRLPYTLLVDSDHVTKIISIHGLVAQEDHTTYWMHFWMNYHVDHLNINWYFWLTEYPLFCHLWFDTVVLLLIWSDWKILNHC